MRLFGPFLDWFAALPHNVQRLFALLMVAVIGHRLATLVGRVVERAAEKFGKNSTPIGENILNWNERKSHT